MWRGVSKTLTLLLLCLSATAVAEEVYSLTGIAAHDLIPNSNGWALHLDGITQFDKKEWKVTIPVLVGHQYDKSHTIGYVDTLWIENDTLMFSAKLDFPEKAAHWKGLVLDGHITGVSIGINTIREHKHELTDECFKSSTLVEISIVIKPADKDAMVLSISKDEK